MNTEQTHTFYKYQGTGNDFVLVDNRDGHFPKENTVLVNFLCDRRFGIGADGLILLEESDQYDFHMVYYNSDGKTSTMCGNGGRCIVAFAKYLGMITTDTVFSAVDGHHSAAVDGDVVSLGMIAVDNIRQTDKYHFLDTGSPHHVQVVQDLENLNVAHEGAKIRYGIYGAPGSNVNFVSKIDDTHFKVRTYERGVEGETLSCGTGVTAVALAMHHANRAKGNTIRITTQGGDLKVAFEIDTLGYNDIQLIGPAKLVFKGEISW